MHGLVLIVLTIANVIYVYVMLYVSLGHDFLGQKLPCWRAEISVILLLLLLLFIVNQQDPPGV